VHPDLDTPDWDYVHNRIAVWATETTPNDWQKRELFAQLYGAKATVQIGFCTTEKEEKVGMSRFDDIQARLRELEKEAAKYARFERVDPWPVGAVVIYDMVYYSKAEGEQEFTYAVLKCGNGNWYWTGHGVQTRSGGSYDLLVEYLADEGVSNIRVALPADFKPLFPEETTAELAAAAEKVDEKASTGVYVPVVKSAPEKNG
jgi:hypothetical protein